MKKFEIMIKNILILLLLKYQVGSVVSEKCFNEVSFTVYRGYRKVVLQRADTIIDEIDATEISAEKQHMPVLQSGCFKNLPKLKYITINECGLRDIQKSAFLELPNLKAISVTFNNIQVIKNGVFNSLGIVKLSLVGNFIQQVEQHAFYNLTSLEILDLSHNNLYSLNPNIFFQTNNLRQINLSNNKLLFIYDYFFWDCFAAAEEYNTLIDLSYNNISVIERNTFKGVYYINTLLLNDNSIEKIDPKVFSDVKKGDTLDLRNNVLHKVPDKVLYGKFEQVYYDEDISKEEDEVMGFPVSIGNVSSESQNDSSIVLNQEE